MKKIINLFLTLALLLLPLFAHAGKDVYYVTQKGAGARNGSSLSNAWSVSDFNKTTNWSATDRSNKIDPGDTVYFSGTITTTVVPKGGGTAGNPITLDGYKAGNCDPLDSVCSSSAIVKGGIEIRRGPDYINIYDFRFTECNTSYACLQINLPTESGQSNNIAVKRNHIYDVDEVMFSCTTSSSGGGSDYVTVENNKMSGYGRSGNPPAGTNFVDATNLVIRDNIFSGGGSSGCTSDNIMELHGCENVLIEYNDIHSAYNQAGISIKEGYGGNQNVIVRFNKLHDNGNRKEGRGMGVGWYESYNVYIYANYIYNNGSFGMDIKDGIDDVYIWSNLFNNHPSAGISIWDRGFGYHSENLHFTNNTFYRNGHSITDSKWVGVTAINFGDSQNKNLLVKNNIFCNNRPYAKNSNQVTISSTGQFGDGFFEHNTYYLKGKTATIYVNGSERSLDTMKRTYEMEDNAPEGEIANPKFTDPNGVDNKNGTADDDFTLDGTNINDGADLSKCWSVKVQDTTHKICLDDALDPVKTDWTQTPPVVYTVKQDSQGSRWERGAYVYTGSQTQPKEPEEVLSAPTGLRAVEVEQ